MNLPFSPIDLSHVLSQEIPTWNYSCGFRMKCTCDYKDCAPNEEFKIHSLEMEAGIGTHIDAPAHCFKGGRMINELPLKELMAPCIVIDVSEKAQENYSVLPEDIAEFEGKYGLIEPGTFVLIRTGWDQFWNTPEKYHNQYQFPSVSKSATELLLKRDIRGLGIDTLSPDRPKDGFSVHHLLLGANKYIIENIANLQSMPPIGAYIVAFPLNLKSGTEAPVRLVGLIGNK